MRIVLEVEGGEVTFTIRQAGQTTGGTQGMALAQVGTSRAVDAGPAPQMIPYRPAVFSSSRGRSQAVAGGESTPSAGSRAQAPRQAATDAGPAPHRLAAATQAAPPSRQAGESFGLMGGAGKDAGSAPALRSQRRMIPSKRRVAHSNGGKSK